MLRYDSANQLVGKYNTIQMAVNAASSGDKIYACGGTYNETGGLSVPVSNITIAGENKNTTIIQISSPLSLTSYVVNITGNNVNFSNFTVQNGSDTTAVYSMTGIHVTGTGCYIHDNIITNLNQSSIGWSDGIGFTDGGSANNNIVSNYMGEGTGIYSMGGPATITNNTITGNGSDSEVGINVAIDTYVTITGNTITNHNGSGAFGIYIGAPVDNGTASSVSISGKNVLQNNSFGIYINQYKTIIAIS